MEDHEPSIAVAQVQRTQNLHADPILTLAESESLPLRSREIMRC